MVRFLRNTWYVAAWDYELGRDLLSRRILNEPVVMFRKENGEPAAIANRCPHRFAPLHTGKLKGDTVECGYHGLRFDGTGACVHNPHGDGRIPAAAWVKAYEVVERHGALWIWMGDPQQADPDLIADFSHITDPARKTLRGVRKLSANYELIVDNVMDASHAQFVHAQFVASDVFDKIVQEIAQEGETIYNRYLRPGETVPRSFAGYLDGPVDTVDHWIDWRWNAPSVLCNWNGITPQGHSRAEGVEKMGTHIVTPETDTTSHYFYGHSRNFKCDDPAIDEQILTWQRVAFAEEDGPMIEDCQDMMGTADLMSLRPVLLPSDAAVVKVRRQLARMIERETAGGETTWSAAQ